MRDLFAYRGWPWWFGTAWLMLAVIAILLEVRFLGAAVFFLFGAAIVGYAIEGLRTGIVEIKFGTYSRLRNPEGFWFYVLFYLVFGSMFIMASIVGLLRSLSR